MITWHLLVAARNAVFPYDLSVQGAADGGSSADVKSSGNVWKGRGLPVTRQRIIYQGRQLQDEFVVQACNILPESFVQVFVRPT